MDARLERLKAIIEQTVAERDQLIEDRDRLIEEIKGALTVNGNITRERDEARLLARFYRDCYAVLMMAKGDEVRLPWECGDDG